MPKREEKVTMPTTPKKQFIGFACPADLGAAIRTEQARMREEQPGSRVSTSDVMRRLVMAGIAAIRSGKEARPERRAK